MKKDWSETIVTNARLFPKAVANNQMATEAMLDRTGTLSNDPRYQKFLKSIPKKKEYKTTNAEEAKILGTTSRQVSKMRNGKKPFPVNQ